MPRRPDARREVFAQELAKGTPQLVAYGNAGFKPVASNAARLAAHPDVRARVAELQGAAAERAVVTIHDIADQLDEDRAFARECEVPGACVSATMGKAKVLGLLPDKHELTGRDGKDLIPDMTDGDLARLIVFQLTKAAKAAD